MSIPSFTGLTGFTMAQVDAMDKAAFVAAFGGLFEHSPWVAEAAWASRPFADADALHTAMMMQVRLATPAQQIAFFNLHPELAGREAQAGTMTGHSTVEQRGLDALSRADVMELRRLNAAYAERHGFPFIIAVLGHAPAQIFEALRMRIERDTPAEIAQALSQVSRITRSRLQALLTRTGGGDGRTESTSHGGEAP